VIEIPASLPALVGSIVIGYLLGALPLADRISHRYGVDIFSAGTRLAGASNVRRSVGRIPGLVVLVGDMGKGALVIVTAVFLGIESIALMLPAVAAVLGHWKSVFSRFRGGDGLATLGGAVLTMFPAIGLISVLVGMLFQLVGNKIPFSSLMGIVFGYVTLVALSLAYDRDTLLVLGTGGLASLVLTHALLGHRRRRYISDWNDAEEEWELEPVRKWLSTYLARVLW
jgi:glycerol-3-phosphate acyltransferase PlsY